MSKKRIIIPIVGQGSIIHFIRTGMLDRVSEFITPVIAISWQEPALAEELVGKGYSVEVIPAYETSAEYNALRSKITLWYNHHVLKSPTHKILRNFLELYLPKKKIWKRKIKNFYARLLFYSLPGYTKKTY